MSAAVVTVSGSRMRKWQETQSLLRSRAIRDGLSMLAKVDDNVRSVT